MSEMMFDVFVLAAVMSPFLLLLALGGLICDIIEKVVEKDPWKRLSR